LIPSQSSLFLQTSFPRWAIFIPIVSHPLPCAGAGGLAAQGGGGEHKVEPKAVDLQHTFSKGTEPERHKTDNVLPTSLFRHTS